MKFALRVLLVLVATFVSVVLVEGVHSLWTGRSMLALTHPLGGGARLDLLDAERRSAAALTAGPAALSDDPLVAFTIKPERTVQFHGVDATTDAWGQRRRLGPPPEPGAPRVVVLGDSSAFGWGVADDQTFAHQLESFLAATLPPDAPRPVVQTVASPLWNVSNSCRYLRDHLARLQPDVVIFVPVGNDLHDSFAVTEAGHWSFAFDPAVGGTRPVVSLESYFLLLAAMEPRLSQAARLEILAAGGVQTLQHAILTDVLPESRRRWSAFTAELADLQARLAHGGAHLLVHLLLDDDFSRKVEAELQERVAGLAISGPFTDPVASDWLSGDAHPSAACVRAAAWCMAERLIAEGWVVAAGARSLPALDSAYAVRRRPLRSPGEAERWADERRQFYAQQIHARIDLRDATGFQQIYGGVATDGAVGRGLFLGLRTTGARQLVLELERLSVASGVYPLAIEVRIGDGVWRSADLPAPDVDGDSVCTLRFDCPEAAQSGDFVDVQLRATNWVVETVDGKQRLISCRLLSIGFSAL